MSTGGGGDFGSLGSASVEVQADMRGLDAAFAALPQSLDQRIEAAERKVRARMAGISLAIKAAMAAGGQAGTPGIDALTAKLERLKGQLDSVRVAAERAAGNPNGIGLSQGAGDATRRYAADLVRRSGAGPAAAADIARLNRRMANSAPDEMAGIQAKIDAATARMRSAGGPGPIDGFAGAAGSTGKYARSLDAAAKGQDRVRGSGRSLGTTLLYVSQAADDMQYSFSAAVNNVPGIVMALGGSAGLAGGLQVAAIAANYAINNWSKLKETFGETSEIGGAMSAIQSLAEALGLASSATDKLREAEAKRRKAAAAVADSIKPKGSEERADSYRDAIAEAGGGKAVAQMLFDKVAKPVRDPKGEAAREKRHQDDLAAAAWDPAARARMVEDLVSQAQDKRAAANELDRIKAMLGRLASGEGTADDEKQIASMARKTPLAGALERNSVAARAKAAEADKAKADMEEARVKAEDEAERKQEELGRKADQAAAAMGPRFTLGILDMKPGHEAARNAMMDRLTKTGHGEDEAEAIAEQAAKNEAKRVQERIKAAIMAGRPNMSAEDAVDDLRKEERAKLANDRPELGAPELRARGREAADAGGSRFRLDVLANPEADVRERMANRLKRMRGYDAAGAKDTAAQAFKEEREDIEKEINDLIGADATKNLTRADAIKQIQAKARVDLGIEMDADEARKKMERGEDRGISVFASVPEWLQKLQTTPSEDRNLKAAQDMNKKIDDSNKYLKVISERVGKPAGWANRAAPAPVR